MKYTMIIIILFLSACASIPHEDSALCPSIAGTSDLIELINDTERPVLILGERHGHNEGAEYFADIICHIDKEYGKILIAIELDYEFNPVLKKAWSSSVKEKIGSYVSRNISTELPQDGSITEATFDSLDVIKSRMSTEQRIQIFAFDGISSPEQMERLSRVSPPQQALENALAENVVTALNNVKVDVAVILTGRVHASKSELKFGSQHFKPMAQLIDEDSFDVISLMQTDNGGTSWFCHFEADSDSFNCGSQVVSARGEDDFLEGITLDGTIIPKSFGEFDGYYHVGEISTSTPVANSKQ